VKLRAVTENTGYERRRRRDGQIKDGGIRQEWA